MIPVLTMMIYAICSIKGNCVNIPHFYRIQRRHLNISQNILTTDWPLNKSEISTDIDLVKKSAVPLCVASVTLLCISSNTSFTGRNASTFTIPTLCLACRDPVDQKSVFPSCILGNAVEATFYGDLKSQNILKGTDHWPLKICMDNFWMACTILT